MRFGLGFCTNVVRRPPESFFSSLLANLPSPQVDGVIDVEVNRPAWSVIVHDDVDVNPLDDVMEHIPPHDR